MMENVKEFIFFIIHYPFLKLCTKTMEKRSEFQRGTHLALTSAKSKLKLELRTAAFSSRSAFN
jgi:hypothetical protein